MHRFRVEICFDMTTFGRTGVVKVAFHLIFAAVAALLLATPAWTQNANTPRGIYRARPVDGSPTLLASGMVWSDSGLVIADRKEKRLIVLRANGKFETLRKMTQPFW